MCADYTPSRKEQVEESFRTGYPLLDLPPEAWPGYMAPILRGSHEAPGELEIAPAMFGMVPHWADLKLARQTYNARTETVASKPSFRTAWLLRRIDVGEVWGVGRRIGAKLRAMGINTVQDLKDAPPSTMRAHFGVVLERTCNELRGISCLELEEVAPPRKEIVSSRSFGTMVITAAELGESISTYAARAGEKLRGQHSLCGAVHVFVQTNRFREKDEQYSNGITIPLVEPSADNRVLAGAALHGLAMIFRDGFKYKKAGIMLMDLQPDTQRQAVLFNADPDRARSVRAMAALDALNERFGRDTVHLGSAGLVRRWAMLSENRTPRYTTNWMELPKVRAR